jgi:glycoprotein endo-alpha-1,2-mannosidase
VKRLRLLIVLCALVAVSPARAEPRVAIFYYPWYGTPALDGAYQHWDQSGHQPPSDIAAAYYPARGAYSSTNRRVVARQMRDIAGAGVGEVVSSWWGRFSAEDARLPAVTAAAQTRGLEVAIHLEPYPGRTIESVRADLDYLRGLGIRDVYVYRAGDLPRDDWAAVTAGAAGMRLFAQTTHPGFAAAGGFAGVYTYDIARYGGWEFARLCQQAHAKGLLCAPSVGPGYDAQRCTGDRVVKPRRAGLAYDAMWGAAIAAGADLVTITSYNEGGEGTQIEPAGRGRGGAGYRNYSGAYGLHGRAAERAYLERTAYWAARFTK